MRILVATDQIDALSAAEAGAVLASGWPSAEVTVLPLGDAGSAFVSAYADLVGADVAQWVEGEALVTAFRTAEAAALHLSRPRGGDSIDREASSSTLGAAVLALLSEGGTQRLMLDLTGSGAHDGGAGLLSALGAAADRPLDRGAAGLEGISFVDLAPVRAALRGVQLIGVVPAGERAQPLLGLRGITSLHGRAAGLDPGVLLRTDAALEAFSRAVAPTAGTAPGAGACGGLGLAVMALGGRLITGPELGLQSPRAVAALRRPDLVVTGCSRFDFASRGGGVVAAVAEAAARALSPCVLIAGEVVIGAREMRTMGVEAAYAVHDSTPSGATRSPGSTAVSEHDLLATARRVARSWSW